MEVSMRNRPRIEYLALWAIAVLLAAPCCVCQDQSFLYGVAIGGEGGPFNWRRQASISYYQDWADRVTLYVNDSLYFSYDSSQYDVLNPSRAAWADCSIDFNNIGLYSSGGELVVIFPSPGTFLFMSSGWAASNISQDCLNGMKFGVTVSDRTSDSPAPPPWSPPAPAPAPSPPPPQTPGNPPPNAGTSPPPAPAPSPPPPQTPGNPPPNAGTFPPPPPVYVAQPPPPLPVAQPPPAPEAALPPGAVLSNGGSNKIEWSRQPVANHYETTLGKRLAAGSTLEFFFANGSNVREVSQSEYDSCTATTFRPRFLSSLSPATVQLTENRTYYFIDSLGDNCRVGNMKLSVQVGDPEQESTPVAGQKKTTFPVAGDPRLNILFLFRGGRDHVRKRLPKRRFREN